MQSFENDDAAASQIAMKNLWTYVWVGWQRYNNGGLISYLHCQLLAWHAYYSAFICLCVNAATFWGAKTFPFLVWLLSSKYGLKPSLWHSLGSTTSVHSPCLYRFFLPTKVSTNLMAELMSLPSSWNHLMVPTSGLACFNWEILVQCLWSITGMSW